MGNEVGSAQVAVFPTFKGFRKATTKEIDSTSKQAGSRFSKALEGAAKGGGRSAGRGFKAAFDSSTKGIATATTKQLTAQIAVATRALSASRLKQQDMAGKVRVAEAALNDARAKGVAGSARVVAAEERLAAATRNLDAAQDNTAQSSATLLAAQKRLADGTVVSTEKTKRSLRSLISSTFSRASSAGGKAGSQMGRGFANAFRSALAPIAGIAAGYIGFQAVTTILRKLKSAITDGVDSLARIETINAQTKAVIKSTGKAANISGRQITKLADRLERYTGTEAESIQQGANLLLTFKNIRNEAGKGNKIFDMSVTALTDMARAMGKPPAAAAVQLGKALNDPIKGITALSKVGVSFSEDQKKVIKSLVETGDVAGAQKIILAELNSEFGGSGRAYAKTYAGTLEGVRNEAGNLQETLTSGVMPTLKRFADLTLNVLQSLNDSPWLPAFTKKVNNFGQIAGDKFAGVIRLVKYLSKSDEGVTFDGLRNGLTKLFPFLTPLNDFFTAIAPAIPAFKDAVALIAPALAPLIPTLSQVVIDLLPTLVDLIVTLAPVLPPLVEGIGKLIPAIQFLADVLGFIIETTEGVAGFFGAMSTGANTTETAMDAVNGKFGAFVGFFAGIGLAISQFIASFNANLDRGAEQFALFIDGILTEFGHFGSDVGTVFGKVVAFFTGLPTKISNAVSGFGTLLVNTGRNLVQGLIDGVKGMAANAVKAVTDVGNNLVSGINNVLGIHSPSRVFKKIGQFVVAGFTDGVTGDLGKVRTVISKLSKTILSVRKDLSKQQRRALAQDVRDQARITKKTFRSGSTAGTSSILSSLSSAAQLRKNAKVEKITLADIARARENVATRLKSASKKLSDALGLRNDFSASVKSAVIGFGDITNAAETMAVTVSTKVGGVLQSVTQNVASGAASMVQNLRDSVAKTQAFQSVLAKLQALGIDSVSYKQLVDQFTSSGSTAAADALLAGGKAAVSEVGVLQKVLSRAGDALGKATSTALYQAGVDAARGLVNGLKANDKLLAEAAKSLAKKITAAVKKELGIHSPSTVFAALGRFTSQGFINGISSMSAKVSAAAAGMLNVPTVAASAAGSGSSAAGSDRPIYTDSGVLIGWMRQIANGEARLVFNTEVLGGAVAL